MTLKRITGWTIFCVDGWVSRDLKGKEELARGAKEHGKCFYQEEQHTRPGGRREPCLFYPSKLSFSRSLPELTSCTYCLFHIFLALSGPWSKQLQKEDVQKSKINITIILIHFKSVSVNGVRQSPSIILLHVNIQLFQHYLLKSMSSPVSEMLVAESQQWVGTYSLWNSSLQHVCNTFKIKYCRGRGVIYLIKWWCSHQKNGIWYTISKMNI